MVEEDSLVNEWSNYRILSTNLFNKKSYHAKVHCTAEKVSFEW